MFIGISWGIHDAGDPAPTPYAAKQKSDTLGQQGKGSLLTTAVPALVSKRVRGLFSVPVTMQDIY